MILKIVFCVLLFQIVFCFLSCTKESKSIVIYYDQLPYDFQLEDYEQYVSDIDTLEHALGFVVWFDEVHIVMDSVIIITKASSTVNQSEQVITGFTITEREANLQLIIKKIGYTRKDTSTMKIESISPNESSQLYMEELYNDDLEVFYRFFPHAKTPSITILEWDKRPSK
jgi:hypothetical protein